MVGAAGESARAVRNTVKPFCSAPNPRHGAGTHSSPPTDPSPEQPQHWSPDPGEAPGTRRSVASHPFGSAITKGPETAPPHRHPPPPPRPAVAQPSPSPPFSGCRNGLSQRSVRVAEAAALTPGWYPRAAPAGSPRASFLLGASFLLAAGAGADHALTQVWAPRMGSAAAQPSASDRGPQA